MRNSPLKVEMAKRPEQWKHISIDGNGACVPQNALIEVLGMRIQRIVFGQSTEVLGTGRGQDRAAGGRDRWIALSAETMTARIKSQQRGWLKKVSKCVT